MSRATLKWLEKRMVLARIATMIADICDRLDEGEEMGVDYLYPGTGGPIRVTVRKRAPSKERWVLDGLFPAECDTIRSHVCKEEWRDGPHPLHELCVIATLATIIQGRGIRLDPCTGIFASILHGSDATIFCGVSPLSPYCRVSFTKAVEEGQYRDAVADFLAEQQDSLTRPQSRA